MCESRSVLEASNKMLWYGESSEVEDGQGLATKSTQLMTLLRRKSCMEVR